MFTFLRSVVSRLQVNFFGACLIALLFFGINQVHAGNFCVSTPTELTDALTLAQFNGGSNSVRLRPGTYVMPNAVLFDNVFGGDLFISGDWNAGCSVRGVNPFATVINGQGAATAVWSLRSASIDITIQQIRFSNMRFIEFADSIGGSCTPAGQKFVVRRSIIDGPSLDPRLIFGSDCHAIIVENSLVQGGSIGIRIIASADADQAPSVRLVQNTVTGAQIEGVLVTNFVSDGANVELYNNISYGHGGDDVRIFTDKPTIAIGNNWGEIDLAGGGGLSPLSSNNVTTNPQLQTNGRPIEPGSGVINTASNSVPGGLPGTDIEGNARVIGSAPDRGAFETNVSNITVLSVTDPNDSGPGTLREAIITANASPGAQIITFNIPGACPQSIFLQSPLPSLTDTGLLLINGETQPGSSVNTLVDGNNATICIQLRRSFSVPSVSRAIRVPVGSDSFLWLRGIGFGGFTNAIELAGGNGHLIQGNRFGAPLPSNSIGVLIDPGSNGAKIGGTDSPALRNTFADSTFAGIFINGGASVEIGNNYIGTDPNGLAAAPNNVGVFVSNALGTRIFSNVISGNTLSGILLSGAQTSATVITDNHIGVSRNTTSGAFPRGNGAAGVNIVSAAHDNRIGGNLRNSSNIIASNGGDGVAVQSGQRNTISSNRIFANAELGIDLAANGVNPNDDDANPVPLDYANRGLNFPVLLSALGSSASGSVSGNLSTTRGGYRLEFFMNAACDASGHGEGSAQVGALDVIIPNLPGQQTVAFTANLQSADSQLGGWISATATDSSGNTSEFSACAAYVVSDIIFANSFE